MPFPQTGRAVRAETYPEQAESSAMHEPLIIEFDWTEAGEPHSVRLQLDGQPLSIGRSPDNLLVLNDASVSRHHAEIMVTAQGIFLRDMNSRFGTQVNQKQLAPVKLEALLQNAELQFGRQTVQMRRVTDLQQEQEFAIWALHELQHRFSQVRQLTLDALQQASQQPALVTELSQQLEQQFHQIQQETDIWSAQNTLLQQLNTLLNQTQGHQALLQNAMPLLADVLGAARGFMLLWDSREQCFDICADHGYAAARDIESIDPQVQFSQLLARHSFEQRQLLSLEHPLHIRAVAAQLLGDATAEAACAEQGDSSKTMVQSLLALPIFYADDVMAVLYLDSPGLYCFSHLQQAFLRTLQLQLGLALKSAICLSRALTDDLTGVFSRNMLEEHITQAMDQAKRYGHPCSLIFLDIDNFKQINDVHGHLVGDEVLKKVARLMLNAARKTDVVGRLGGEEFVLLLAGTALQGAVQHAERLRQDIAALLLPVRGQPQPLQITASLGVAEYHTALHNLAYRFIECADQAMYQAKRSGKNRVCQHKPSQQQLTATELDLLRHHAPRA